MDYLSKLHMIFLSKDELARLFKDYMLHAIDTKLNQHSLNYFDLLDNTELKHGITDSIVAKNVKNKEDVEIFTALVICISFYGSDSTIGFPLKDSFNPKTNPVKTLQELKDASKENHLTDFAIMRDDGLRQFQLKQYKGEPTTEALLAFIKKKIDSYGATFDYENIVFLLQGRELPMFTEWDIDFETIHNELCKMSIETKAEIIILHNEKNEQHIMTQVYPELNVSRKDFTSAMLRGEL